MMMEQAGDHAGQAPATGATGTGSERDIETHFTVIAVINLIFAIPVALLGAFLFLGGLVGGGITEAASDLPGIGALVAGAGFLIGLLFLLAATPGIVSAVGLIKQRSWAKPWTIVVGVLNLINIPFGTVFGIYAIWAMTRPETDAALG